MNTETGKIVEFTESKTQEELKELFGTDELGIQKMVPVNKDDMTKKQDKQKQVSKYDNKSKLGQLFTGNRKERRWKEKEYRRNIKKGR